MFTNLRFSKILNALSGPVVVAGLLSFCVSVVTAESALAAAPLPNIDCVARLETSGAGLVVEAPLTIENLRTDAEAYVQIIDACWSNRRLHEASDKFQFRALAKNLIRELRKPTTDLNGGLDALYDFSMALHDGHLSFSDPRPNEYFYSGLRFIETGRGLSLVACENSALDCGGLKLPALVEAVDGVEIKTWLARRSELSMGSTRVGRDYHARGSLESWMRAKGSKSPQAKLPSKLKFTDALGKLQSLAFAWKQDAPTWTVKESSLPCVSSQNRNGVFVLKLTSFFCLQERDPEGGGGPDAALIPALTKSLAEATAFDSVVLDLRGNTGGLPGAAMWLVGRLSPNEKTYYFGTEIFRSGNGINDEYAPRVSSTDAHDKDFRLKPIRILADGGCFSQCSIMVHALVSSGRAVLVGSIDSGAGGPRYWRSPSGRWGAEIPIWTTLSSDRSYIEGRAVKGQRSLSIPESLLLTEDPELEAVLATSP